MSISKPHPARRAVLLASAAAVALPYRALAADAGPIKIGLLLPMTGQQASTGRPDRRRGEALGGAERQQDRRAAPSR
jgi:hypothetical protein